MKEYRKQGHCVYYAQYHLVFVTKYRRKIFNEGVKEYLKKIIHRITDHHAEIHVLMCNTDQDHVHLQVVIPPKYSVSKVVALLKANTSRTLREKFEFIKEVYYGEAKLWSDGYFVSTIGVNEEIIRRYIEMQGAEDAGQAKLEF